MKKIFAVLLALALAFSPTAFAADVDVQEDGTAEGRARTINLGDGLDVSVASGVATVTSGDTTGDVVFRTNLLANGRYGTSTLIMQSSSTPIEAAQLAYAVIQKRVGGAGGLDNLGVGTELANGTPGQSITLQVILLETNGSWVVTPRTATGFTKITFDALKEYATLDYINDTLGWVISGTNATIA